MTEQERLQAAFGKAIRRYRKRAGLSQEKLAELADIHTTYVSTVECGQRNISLWNMHRIAVALGLKLSRIVKEMERYLASRRS